MELFRNAKTVRLRSHHDKYLMADDDKEGVIQERNGGSRRARWTVEHVESGEGVGLIRLKSCYDKYLIATDDDFLLGVRGKKVKQSVPRRLDSSIEWEPIRDGGRLVKLKTRYGNFLRANGGVPPWRNSITHDIPSRSHTQDWILWKLDVLDCYPATTTTNNNNKPVVKEEETDDLEPFSFHPHTRSKSDGSGASSAKNEGRVIHYNVVDDNGNVVNEAGVEGRARCIVYKGDGVEELTKSIEEETGLNDIKLCTRSPLNGKLYPIKLALPPNHVKLHIYVVPSSSKAAAELA